MASSPAAIPSQVSPPRPNEVLVRDLLAKHGGEINLWEQVESHRGIILDDAKRRRRITTERLSPSKGQFLYTLSRGGRVIGGLDGRYSTLVSHQSRRAAQSRQVMRQYLSASSIPVAPGHVFRPEQESSAERFASGFSSPVMIRPASRRTTGGVTTMVEGPQGFREAWKKATEACSDLRPLERLIEVEALSEGLLLRAYVVRETVWAAIVRIPLYVVGDGKSDTATLLKKEETRRKRCAYLKKRSASKDTTSQEGPVGTSPYVPEGGSVTFLDSEPIAESSGALSADILETVSPDLKSLAVDAMWAFPGLAATAVDIMTPSLDSAEGAVVVDVNPGADISEFLYPAYGKPRRMGLAILDQMIATSR